MKQDLKLIPFLFMLTFAMTFSVSSCEGQSETAATESRAASLKNIQVSDLQQMQKEQKDLIIVDVRTPEEWASGTIEGAQKINLFDAEFAEKVQALDKERPIAVICKVGGRSSKAANQMKGMGFTELYNVSGGMDAWKAKSLPVK